jgi:hypothetical protein
MIALSTNGSSWADTAGPHRATGTAPQTETPRLCDAGFHTAGEPYLEGVHGEGLRRINRYGCA